MKCASDPKDVQDFQFKQSSKRQISDGFGNVPTACNLVATDGKRGLLYVGHENKITVLKCNGQTTSEWKFEHELPAAVSRVALSCDNEYLSITFHKSTARIYNASSLTRNNLEALHEIQLSSSSEDVFAYDLKWNPAVPGMFCTVASDHTIGSFMVKTERKTTVGLVAMEKIEGHEVLCVAWSPKGKQIVVGCKNGNIVQLKPDLNIARTIVGPSPNIGGVIAILWISNYQFCATYQDPSDRCIKVLIVDAPKGETSGSFTCYDDITYGMPEAEQSPSRYYLDHVAEWGLIIAASSSSSDVAVLGSPDNGSTWEQWQLVDSGRAQLPLIRTTESYPVGMAIDRSSDTKLALGPETTLPHPVPVLHIFGTSGQLISFHMVNLGPNCPPLCSPPTEIVSAVQVQAPRQSLLPSEISFNLNSGATSTPRPKQAEVPVERPKILPSVNLFNESAKPLAPAPVQQVELKIPKPRAEKFEPPPTKVESRLSPVKEVNPPEKEAVDEGLCLRAYFEEQMLFEKELKAKLEPQTWICGTDEEQKKLVTQSATIDEFLRELRETTNSLSSDMAYLKALLLQSFAWLEETKSKNSANSTDNPRDRGDRNKIKDLERLFFYTQSQLMQATKALDMEWTEYESREKSMIKIPSLEFIYQSLKRHSEIIAKEKNVLESHLKKWKAVTRGKVSGLNKSMAKLNLSASLASGGNNSDGGAIALRCKAIAENTRCFSVDKQLRLRDLLIETKPRVIKAINPSPVQDRLEATLSSLASAGPVSNVPKTKPDRVSTERAISAEQSIPKSTQQSPLASLNSIVAKFGPVTTGESVIQSKTPSKVFSISNTAPLFGGNISQIDKKQTVGAPLIQAKPKQSITVTLSQQPSFPSSQMPSNPRSQAFSEVQSIQFGTPEQKIQEQSAPSMAGDAFSKGLKLSNFKDSFSIGGSTFFQDTSEKTAPPASSTVLTAARNEPQNVASPVGANTTFAGIPEGTTVQEVIREPASSTFNFPSSGQAAISSQQGLSIEVATPASNFQSFSFGSKPIEPPAFSFALKESTPASQGPAQGSSDLPSLFDFDLASIGSQPFSKVSMPTSTLNFGEASSAAAQNTASSPPTTSQPTPRTEESSGAPVAANFFSNAVSTTTTTPFEKAPASVSSGSVFGSGPTESTAAPTSMFGGAAASVLSSSLFGGLSTATNPSLSSPFNVGQQTASATSSSETPTSSAAPSIFGNAGAVATSPLAKTSTESSGTPFGKSPLNFSSPGFGGTIGAPSSTLNFAATAAATASPPAYEKAVEANASTNVFGQSPVVSSASPNVAKASTTAPTPGMFGGTTGTSANPPVFGNISATPGSTIFGGGSSNAQAPSVFEGNSAPIAPFGSPASATIFGGFSQKSPGSVFGGSTAAAQIPAFGRLGAQTATPTGTPQGASLFGQSSAFGAKTLFGGQSSIFGAAKPEFSNPFGGSTFGANAVPTGFSSPPAMGGSPPPLGTASMQKVFGNPVGTSTFESLAGQNGGLTFGSIAQKTPEPQKPPAFSGGSSFSSWR